MAKTQQNILKELDSGKIFPLIVRLSVPAVIAQLITFLYNIVDRMYVAKIDKVGMDALAALGIVLPITLIIQAFANLIGLGGSPRAGIKMGEGNQAEANQIFNLSFLMLALIGVTIGLITFFFAEPIVLFFVQMTLQNVNVALGQARSALILAVTRKVIILIPLCTDKIPWISGRLSLRRNRRFCCRDHHIHCDLYLISENFPQACRRSEKSERKICIIPPHFHILSIQCRIWKSMKNTGGNR